MTRELLVFRHGKSDWTTDASSDFERPLAKRGRKAVKQMGSWLKQQGYLPDCILSSPALRAKQTTLRLCQAAGMDESGIEWQPTFYEAGTIAFLEVLADCPVSKQRVLMVGHNPGLEDLVDYLCGGPLERPMDGKLLPTAALARLQMPNDWSQLEPGCAQLLSLTRPRDLET